MLGGIESPVGAVLGGLLLGLGTTLLGRYVDIIGTALELPVAFAILVLVLILRPGGLSVVRR